jgi:hypothetical protein
VEECAPAFGAGAEIRRAASGAGRVLGEPQIGAVVGPLALRPGRQAFSVRVAGFDEIGPQRRGLFGEREVAGVPLTLTGFVAKRVERVPEVRRMPGAVVLAVASGRRVIEVIYIDLAAGIFGLQDRTRDPVLLEQQIGLRLEVLAVGIELGRCRV